MKTRIGIIFDFSRKWMGGIYYYKSLIRSFEFLEDEKKPEVVLFYTKEFKEFIEDLEYIHLQKIELAEPLQLGIPKRFILSIFKQKNLFYEDILAEHNLDGIYAVNDYPIRVKSTHANKVAAWIPDLQHDFFPQFFDFKRRVFRKIRLQFMLRNASNLIVSSNDVKKNFYEAFNIPSSLKIHTVRFPSINPSQTFDRQILGKYKIDRNYFIVCNQFLQHKNHIIILKGLKIALAKNPNALLVITGNTKAYRQDNYFDELNEFIQLNGLSSNIIITGLIPRDEQLTLIKFADALIQPSKFEGWSTSIEDAKSIDTPVIASKLNVHYEQLEEEGLYFQQDDAEGLANILCNFKRPHNFKYKNDYEISIKQFANDFLNVFNGLFTPSPKIVHINASIGEGSTGRIFKKISDISFASGFISYLAFGRWQKRSKQKNQIHIGSKLNLYFHGVISLLFDKHGFGSYLATQRLIYKIKKIKPNIIQIHSVHGYYINLKVLFTFLKKNSHIQVIWTQHDCWSFTGHCAHFEDIGCNKFETQCYSCPKIQKYPKSLWRDNSRANYLNKKQILDSLDNLQLVAPSKWLEIQFKKSFLKGYKVTHIANGIDLELFRPHGLFEYTDDIQELLSKGLKIVLGVSNAWSNAKGLSDFYYLAENLDESYQIVLIGVEEPSKCIPHSQMIFLKKTENIKKLAMWYSVSNVFVNPTYLDTFPTTNIEALACGTPVITYDAGGSKEAINEDTGLLVKRGDKESLEMAVKIICSKNREKFAIDCRKRAVENYSQEVQFRKYINLYKEVLS